MSLAAAVAETAAEFSGRFALYTENLATGEVFEHHSRQIFHSASTIKLAILTALFRQAAAGALQLGELVTVANENRTGGSGVLQVLSSDVRLTLRDLAVLMTIVSDNTATNECIDAVGLDTVNEMISSLGLDDMRLYRKVRPPGSSPQSSLSDTPFGEASARSLGQLMAMLARYEAAPPDVCEDILTILRQQQWNLFIPRYLPHWEEYTADQAPVVASKSGRIRGLHHDVAAIWHGDVSYVIAIMSDRCADERYHPDNEALVQLPQLAYAVHRYWLEQNESAMAEAEYSEGVSGEWVLVGVYSSIVEADQLASLVCSGGWQAFVRPAGGGGMFLTGVLPGHGVLVPAKDAAAVQAFLQSEPAD